MKTILTILLLPIVSLGAQQPRLLTEANHSVIYRNQGQYSAFPRLYQLPDGTLHVTFRARVTSSHVEPRADTMRFVSKNGGRTWQATEDDAHNPKWASGSAKPGRLVDPNAHAWRYVAAERRNEFEGQGIEVRNSPDARVTYAHGCYVRVSEDNGTTWTQREIDVPKKGLIMSFLGPATDLRLNANTILCSVYGRPTANIRFYESWLLRSEDDGLTWNYLTIAADPPTKHRSTPYRAVMRGARGHHLPTLQRADLRRHISSWLSRAHTQHSEAIASPTPQAAIGLDATTATLVTLGRDPIRTPHLFWRALASDFIPRQLSEVLCPKARNDTRFIQCTGVPEPAVHIDPIAACPHLLRHR